jgi:DNA-binding NarL/FixJ family response regulator
MLTLAPLRVVVVDDHERFRPFARDLLASEGFDVVGEAADAAEAIDVVHELHPDIVLLDIQLPDRDGFSVADELALDADPPAVVLMSSRGAADYGGRVARAPARGFLPKTELSGAALAALTGDDTTREVP